MEIDREWLTRHIGTERGALSEFARSVGIEPNKLSKVLNGTRRLQADEALEIVKYFSLKGILLPGYPSESEAAPEPSALSPKPMSNVSLGVSAIVPDQSLFEDNRSEPKIQISISGNSVQIVAEVDREGLDVLQKKIEILKSLMD